MGGARGGAVGGATAAVSALPHRDVAAEKTSCCSDRPLLSAGEEPSQVLDTVTVTMATPTHVSVKLFYLKPGEKSLDTVNFPESMFHQDVSITLLTCFKPTDKTQKNAF